MRRSTQSFLCGNFDFPNEDFFLFDYFSASILPSFNKVFNTGMENNNDERALLGTGREIAQVDALTSCFLPAKRVSFKEKSFIKQQPNSTA